MTDLEALRLAEAFFARKPEALPSVRAFLLGALLSLFLPRTLETEILLLAVEPYPGRFTNHLILPADPADFPEDLWDWTAEARRFRCGKS